MLTRRVNQDTGVAGSKVWDLLKVLAAYFAETSIVVSGGSAGRAIRACGLIQHAESAKAKSTHAINGTSASISGDVCSWWVREGCAHCRDIPMFWAVFGLKHGNISTVSGSVTVDGVNGLADIVGEADVAADGVHSWVAAGFLVQQGCQFLLYCFLH